MITVVLTPKITGYLPRDVGLGMTVEVVHQDAAWVFRGIGADSEVLVVAHVVDQDREHAFLASFEVGQSERGVVICVLVDAGPGTDEGGVEPDRGAVGGAALGFEGEGFLGAGGGEVTAKEEVAGVEAVVAGVEAGGGVEGAGVVGGLLAGG